MALVAYDTYSDSGESSDEGESTGSCILTTRSSVEGSTAEKMLNSPKVANMKETTDGVSNRIFDLLPSPQGASTDLISVEEQQDTFLSKKPDDVELPKPKVRILLPSLSEYDEAEENPRAADRKTTAKANSSSLFTMLPPPIKTIQPTFLVPRVLQKIGKVAPIGKQVAATDTSGELNSEVEKKPVADARLLIELDLMPKLSPANNFKGIADVGPSSKKNIYKRKAPTSKEVSSDDSDDESGVEYNNKIWKEVCGRKKAREAREPCIKPTAEPQMPELTAEVDPTEPYYGLDNEAFKKLVGYKKKKPENVNVVDIHEADIRADPDISFTKALTDPKCTKRYVPKKPVDDTRKKKHHITFLAEQAKVNQQDLENQWAASRQTRKQTQAKYGF